MLQIRAIVSMKNLNDIDDKQCRSITSSKSIPWRCIAAPTLEDYGLKGCPKPVPWLGICVPELVIVKQPQIGDRGQRLGGDGLAIASLSG